MGERHDLRLVPVAMAAWAGSWLGTWASMGAFAGAAAGVLAILAAAGARRSAWWLAIGLILAASVSVGAVHQHRLTTGPVAELAQAEAIVAVRVRVTSDLTVLPATGVRPPFATARGVLQAVEGRGQAWRVRAPVLITTQGGGIAVWQNAPVGTVLTAPARLRTPNPGADFAAVVRVRGDALVVAPPSAGLRTVERVRAGLRQAVSQRRAEPRALVPALVLGDTSAMTPELNADFSITGLTHLTAVSGANLTLLLAFMLIAARWLRVRGWWLRSVGLAGVVIFVALCRTEPSVLRAAAMGLVALAALGAGGSRRGLRHLSVAMVALLLVDPYLSRSIGFALSVLASAGIVWWAGAWVEVMRRWLPRIIAEAVAVPLSAHLATLPVVAAISGQVSIVGLITNAVAGPFVGPATVLGFAAAGASLLSASLAVALGFGAAWAAQMILWVAHLGAAVPGASWQWPVRPWTVLLLAAGALLVGSVMAFVLARRWLAGLLTMIMIVTLLGAPVQPGWPPKDWVLVACDVGQGDGLVVRVADRAAIVVDVGPDPTAIRRCLDQLRIATVPVLLLTHFHADHVDGLKGVLDHRTVGEIWVSALAEPTYEVAAVDQLARNRQLRVIHPVVGSSATAGEASWEVIGPSPRFALGGSSSESAVNDSSVVVMMTVQGIRILLTGDVEPDGQRAILSDGPDLRADVLKVPHHGSGRQDPDFFAATSAKIAVVSAGMDNDYGHPAPRTVQLLASLGMTLLRTDTGGAVAITASNGRLGAVTQR